MILDRHMPGQCSGIGHDDMTADDAIMCDVRSNHDKVMIADAGMCPSAFRTAMYVDVFPELIVGTDGQKGLFTMKLQILRLHSDHTKREKPVGMADICRTFNNHMRIQLA